MEVIATIAERYAERFAVLAGGRAWTMFGSRKNSKPRVREMLVNRVAKRPSRPLTLC